MRLILLAATLLAALPAAAETVALQCGEVFDSKSARLVGARTIVTSEGRISQVLPNRASVPGAREVDLAGHTCMPGWIDLHVHMASQSGLRSYEERFRLDDADFARQAVRQRYRDGSDVIKIIATGGVMSYAKSGDAPQFTADEVRVIVETAKDSGYAVAAHAHGKEA